jgi:hypothetical protein
VKKNPTTGCCSELQKCPARWLLHRASCIADSQLSTNPCTIGERSSNLFERNKSC